MKILFKTFIVLALFGGTFYACQKDAASGTLDNTAVTTQPREIGDTYVVTLPEVEQTGTGAGTQEVTDRDACCGVTGTGYYLYSNTNNTFSIQMNFTVLGHTIFHANAYRNRFVAYRNDVLVATIIDPISAQTCGYPNGKGFGFTVSTLCAGMITGTCYSEYRIGTTWYTCTPGGSGEVQYFYAGNGNYCE